MITFSFSARQNALQDELYHIQGKRESAQRLIDQEDKEQLDKELSIANIKLSILTLWQYVNSRKVT